MSGLIIKYKEINGEVDANLEYEPWFRLIAEHTWNSETYEGTITLIEGITELPDYIDELTCTYFNGYESITEIEFPEGLIAILGESSCAFLDNLEKLIVPDTIEYLGNFFGSMNSGMQWEDSKMDLVFPTGLKRERYYDDMPMGLYDGDNVKTVTFNTPKENYGDMGYYPFYMSSSIINIKDAIYINCSPDMFKGSFITFEIIDPEQPINVYVAEEYYDMYNFEKFFEFNLDKIANIIKYNPNPEPLAKKAGFNLDNMLDKDYTVEMWDRTDRR